MDDFLPPVIRDNKFFMLPLFYFWFKGKNIKEFMNWKSIVYSLTNEEFCNIYRNMDSRGMDRETGLNSKCISYISSNLEPDSKTLLEVGCGKGFFLKSTAGYEKYGCDLFDQIDIKGVKYQKADVEFLPYEDNQFDIVTCFHTLEHIKNIDRAIYELKRITRKQLIIVVPCQKWYYYSLDLHINFFPIKSILENAINIENHTCINIMGDWVYIGYL